MLVPRGEAELMAGLCVLVNEPLTLCWLLGVDLGIVVGVGVELAVGRYTARSDIVPIS